jgi:hypothetical protein
LPVAGAAVAVPLAVVDVPVGPGVAALFAVSGVAAAAGAAVVSAALFSPPPQAPRTSALAANAKA